MKYTQDFSEYKPWSGAVDTMNKIEEAGMRDDLEMLLEEIYQDELPSDTAINDLLWFDSDWVLEMLGLKEPEDIDID